MKPVLPTGTDHLVTSLERSGFYPAILTEVLLDALDSEEPIADFVHLETHFDRDEVHRHSTVLVLTPKFLLASHVDDHQMDEAGTHVMAQISTEAIPLSRISSVTIAYVFNQPQDYRPGSGPQELTVALAWTGAQRLDVAPASCGDPECVAEHGYAGTLSTEDIILRVSAEADGARALDDASVFAKALRKATATRSAQPHS